jgi:hypothetical protein
MRRRVGEGFAQPTGVDWHYLSLASVLGGMVGENLLANQVTHMPLHTPTNAPTNVRVHMMSRMGIPRKKSGFPSCIHGTPGGSAGYATRNQAANQVADPHIRPLARMSCDAWLAFGENESATGSYG